MSNYAQPSFKFEPSSAQGHFEASAAAASAAALAYAAEGSWRQNLPAQPAQQASYDAHWATGHELYAQNEAPGWVGFQARQPAASWAAPTAAAPAFGHFY